MRYRKLTASGDMTWGHGQTNFYINNAQAVAQSVQTRLGLPTGEWFLDYTQVTPYQPDVVGKPPQGVPDAAIRNVIVNTPGVLSIITYSSNLNRATRQLTVQVNLNTIYGETGVFSVVVST